MKELGAGRIPAGAAVVVGRIPVGKADEQHCIDGIGDVGVGNQMVSRRSLPRARIHADMRSRVGRSSTMTVSMKRCLPCMKSMPPDLGAVMAAAMSLATLGTVSARSPS